MNTIIEKIKKAFTPTPRECKILDITKHKGWGDSVNFDKGEGDRRKIHGFLSNPGLDVGDIVTSPMTKGGVGRWMITKIEHCRDPRDMFFADVKFIGYSDGKDRPNEIPYEKSRRSLFY